MKTAGALLSVASIFLGIAVSSCERSREQRPPSASSPASGSSSKAAAERTPSASQAAAKPLEPLPAASRLIALGDFHGDITAARKALALADVARDDQWTGGTTVVVQTGDILDRGDDELEILELLAKLQAQAKAAGGAIHVLNGNHEIMNVSGDFRYVTPGGLADFASMSPTSAQHERVLSLPPAYAGRAAAFLPGGAWALKLARHPVVLQIGDTVFAHGGVREAHLGRLGSVNEEAARWMEGKAAGPPDLVAGDESLVWTRVYSAGEPEPAACEELSRVLDHLKAKRLVVGHTVQKSGITSACEQKVWRIDVGMAHAYGGRPAALEIKGSEVQALSDSH